MNKEYMSQTLDHPSIVAGVSQQIGLIEHIDDHVPDTGRKVSVGQAIQAMVLNGLGLVGRPLYLTPEFYANKPVDLLIGERLKATDLNADSLWRALDYVYETGIAELFTNVSAHALRCLGLRCALLIWIPPFSVWKGLTNRPLPRGMKTSHNRSVSPMAIPKTVVRI